MTSRATLPAATALLLVTLLSGCAPAPAPMPTATPVFSTEAEAFAAAEETYRSYVEALNAVDLSDPETFEDVYAWTTGEANANERSTLTRMHADGWVVSGQTVIADFLTSDEVDKSAFVNALVCSDVSQVDVVNADGASMVATERPDVYALEVSFVESQESPTGLQISASNATESPRCTS